MSNFFRASGTPQRGDEVPYRLSKARIILGGLMQRCFDGTRRDHVKSNALPGPLHGFASSVTRDGVFGNGVSEVRLSQGVGHFKDLALVTRE